MRLKYYALVSFCLLTLLCLPLAKADTCITTQSFNVDFSSGQGWNIQDIYHNNTIISFTVVNSSLQGLATLNYNNVNGTMEITPSTSGVAINMFSNSTNFYGLFNGGNLTGGAISLPNGVTSTISWQWTPSITTTVSEEEMTAYVIIAAIVVGVVCFALFFAMKKNSED